MESVELRLRHNVMNVMCKFRGREGGEIIG